MADRRGQALVSFAVILPLVLIPVAAYAIEATSLATRQAALAEVAAQVAEDAVQQIDEVTLRAGGPLQIDPSAAQATALASLAARNPAATLRSVVVAGSSVSLVVEERVPLRFAVWAPGGSATIAAPASARLASGYSSPSSLIPLPFSSFSITG